MWNKPSDSERIDAVTAWLDAADIAYDLYFHPASAHDRTGQTPLARRRVETLQNLFFRNHKGNRHYLVCFDCDRTPRSTTSKRGCIRENCRSPRPSA